MKIPPKFYDSLQESLFSNCNICQSELLANQNSYIIEKAFRRFPDNGAEELLFEVAVCVSCAKKMHKQISRGSLKTVNQYFYEKLWDQRPQLIYQDQDYLMHHCLISGQGLSDMQEYQIYAHCEGENISSQGGVYLLSGETITELHEQLSKETKDQLDQYSNDHLGTPPEYKKLLDRKPFIPI